jgi:hypothetical protein
VRVLGEEPGLGLPNQQTKACPRFQTMHCWCPPATGPGQPHESDCVQYKRPVKVDFIEFEPIHGMELSQKEKQALAYVQAHALVTQAYAAAIECKNSAPVRPSPASSDTRRSVHSGRS